MNEPQRLFLAQAQSDHTVWLALQKSGQHPPCHSLHYLQMTVEKLAKSYFWRSGPAPTVHAVFVRFLRAIAHNDRVRTALQVNQKDVWRARLNGFLPVADDIERLAPALAQAGPNAEYPWPPSNPRYAPAQHEFPVWNKLQRSAGGRQLLTFIDELIVVADQCF